MTENLDTVTTNESRFLIVSEKAKRGLKSASIWGIISSSVGFILALFFIYQGVKLYTTISELEEQMAGSPLFSQGGPGGAGGMFTTMKVSAFIIMLLGLITIATGAFIIRFAVSASKAVRLTDEHALENSIKSMRTGFMLTAINCVVMLCGIAYYMYLIDSARGRF